MLHFSPGSAAAYRAAWLGLQLPRYFQTQQCTCLLDSAHSSRAGTAAELSVRAETGVARTCWYRRPLRFNFSIPQYNNKKVNKVVTWCGKIPCDSFGRYSLKIWTLSVTLIMSTAITKHPGPWWCATIPCLVTKGSKVQEIWNKVIF